MEQCIYFADFGIDFTVDNEYADCGTLVDESGNEFSNLKYEVETGKNSPLVTATPTYGYKFVEWSDGNSNPTRAIENVTKSTTVKAIFEKREFHLTYAAAEHGHLVGQKSQTVKYKGSGTKVTAIGDEGYRFKSWSDGHGAPAARTDTNVTEDVDCIATFEPIVNIYDFVCNKGTLKVPPLGTPLLLNVKISYADFENVKLPVAMRENSVFEGWYVDEDLTIQVSDEEGNLVIDKSLFDYPSDKLYAKYSVVEKVVYKVLLIFAPEIYGRFSTINQLSGSEIKTVDISMSDTDKRICRQITTNLQDKLNRLTDGLVEFEVDDYFLQSTLTETNFKLERRWDSDRYILDLNTLAEFVDNPILNDYGSIITSFNFGDYTNTNFNMGTTSCTKNNCGNIYLDSFFRNKDVFLTSNNPDYDKYWDNILYAYTHEFIHTVEKEAVGEYSWHDIYDYIINEDHSELWEYCGNYLVGKLNLNYNQF